MTQLLCLLLFYSFILISDNGTRKKVSKVSKFRAENFQENFG